MSNALEICDLNKSYGDNRVIKSISFDVRQGEIFALLGTNGAGKTTTLECIEGLKSYDGGSISRTGKIGVQMQSSSLPANIKAHEAMRLFAKWNRAPLEESVMKALGIDEIKNKQYRDMSTGQKRRLHLAIALIGNPDIIFLDEPTAGLDVEGRTRLHEQIRQLKESGKTIIMASHDMSEVENLCDRIAILKDGKIGFMGTAWELTNKAGASSVIQIKTSSGEERLTTDNMVDTLLEVLHSYRQRQITVEDIKVERASLEERFMDIARGD